MSRETSKCTSRRMAQGHLQKLVGRGLDIGAGDDPFQPVAGECRAWDRKHGDGDAAKLPGVAAGSLDYVYSSHCLEHLPDPLAALRRWTEVVRPGGFLYLAVPDYDLYEGGKGLRNRFHKTAFSLHRPADPSIPLLNLPELLSGPLRGSLRLWYLGLCDDRYDHRLGTSVDQTRRGAVCHIEILAERLAPVSAAAVPTPEILSGSRSKESQDLFVLSVLAGKRTGSYLEIGAGHPVHHSNTWLLETGFSWKGVSLDIDPRQVERHARLRRNPCRCADATETDFGALLEEHGLGPALDYLQVDVDPAHNSLKALQRIDLSRFRFAVVTFEHDRYRNEGREQALSREILGRHGYRLVVGDVMNRHRAFEDWYVDESLMPDDFWRRFSGEGVRMDPAGLSPCHRELFGTLPARSPAKGATG